jgi:hypothetical protein
MRKVTCMKGMDEALEGKEDKRFFILLGDLDKLRKIKISTRTPVRGREGGWEERAVNDTWYPQADRISKSG